MDVSSIGTKVSQPVLKLTDTGTDGQAEADRSKHFQRNRLRRPRREGGIKRLCEKKDGKDDERVGPAIVCASLGGEEKPYPFWNVLRCGLTDDD